MLLEVHFYRFGVFVFFVIFCYFGYYDYISSLYSSIPVQYFFIVNETGISIAEYSLYDYEFLSILKVCDSFYEVNKLLLSVCLNDHFWSTEIIRLIRVIVTVLCAFLLISLMVELVERRFLVFLVVLEVVLVLLTSLIVFGGIMSTVNVGGQYCAALCIFASGGADTALILALFMTYYRVTGQTEILDFVEEKNVNRASLG